MRIVYGNIESDGGIISGSGGFDVSLVDTGLWDIHFDVHFNNIPAVTASQLYSDSSDTTGHGGSTLDNVTLVSLDKNRVRLKTGNASGEPRNRHFTFIAIGE